MIKITFTQRFAAALCGILGSISFNASLSLLEYPLVWLTLAVSAVIIVEAFCIAFMKYSPSWKLSVIIGARGALMLGLLMILAACGILIFNIFTDEQMMAWLLVIFTVALLWVFMNIFIDYMKGVHHELQQNICSILMIFVSVTVFIFIRSQQVVMIIPPAILAVAMVNIALSSLLSAIMSR